ncbi:MAG: tetratricopeptide repeat protein [Bacteroidia bacterium]
MERPLDIHAHNENIQSELLRLIDTDSSNWVLVESDNEEMRNLLLEGIVAETSHLSHLVLDLADTQVTSLTEIAKEKLATLVADTPPSETIIHIINLESSLPEEILSGKQVLLNNLNDAPDVLSDWFAARWIFWTDSYTAQRIDKQAPAFKGKIARTFSLYAPEKPGQEDPYDKLEQLAVRYQQSDIAPEEKSSIALGIAETFGRFRKWTQAKVYLDEVIAQGEAETPSAHVYEAHRLLGNNLFESRAYSEALAHLDKALEGISVEEDPGRYAKTFHQKGLIQFRSGYSSEAEDSFNESVKGYQFAEDFAALGNVYNDIAMLHEKVGNVKKTLDNYRKSAEVWRETGKMAEVAKALQHVGAINQIRHNWQEALDAFREALDAAKEAEDEFLETALEDSVEQMSEAIAEKGSAEKKKGFLGRLFG